MSTMNQILKNKQGGNLGLRDAMHRAIPGAERYEPVAQADGSYGALPFIFDPSQPVRVTDKYKAKEVIDPSSETMRSVGGRVLTYGSGMPAGGGGGGGGGGGSMRSRDERAARKKITSFGPRNTAEYVAKNGGLSAPRESTLDSAYKSGALRGPRAPADYTPPAARRGPLPPEQAFDPFGGPAAGAGGAVGDAVGSILGGAWPPKRLATGGPLAPRQPAVVGDPPPWGGPPRPETLITPDGQVIPVGQGGEEVIAPAQGGVVIPHPQTVREMKGPLSRLPTDDVYATPDGIFAGFTSPSGSGFATRLPVRSGNSMAASILPPWMRDPKTGMQVTPGNSAEFVPDTITGPWAQPGAAVTPEMERDLAAGTRGRALALPARGAGPMMRYEATPVIDGLTKEEVTLAEMRGRIIDRSSMTQQAREDARVRQHVAQRAARAPLGTPTGPLAPGLSPRAQRKQDRAMEQFLTTPQGAMWAAEQQQQAASAQAAGQWQMMTDPSTGKHFAMVNGRGQTVSLPNMADDEKIVFVEEEGQNEFGFPIIRKTPMIANVKAGTTRRFSMEDGTPVQAPPPVKSKASTTQQPATTPDSPASAGANSFVNRFKKRN